MDGSDRFSAMLAELDRQRAELERAREALDALTARATSSDRLITATVNARGLLVELSIEPIAMRRYRADQMSEVITALVAQADDGLRRQRESVVQACIAPEHTFADLPEIMGHNGFEGSANG